MKTKSLYGRLMSALTMLVTVGLLVLPMKASAVTVSKSFTNHSLAGDPLLVFGGESLTFAVSGTFSGTVYLQQSQNGSDYKNTSAYFSGVNLTSSTVFYANTALGKPEYFRVYCSTYTSGTIVTSLADINDVVQVIKNLKGADIVTIYDDGIAGAGLADSAVVTAKLLADSVIAAKIMDGSVVTNKLAADSVVTAKLLADSVVTAKLLADSVVTAKIINFAVTTNKLADSAVSTGKLLLSGIPVSGKVLCWKGGNGSNIGSYTITGGVISGECN